MRKPLPRRNRTRYFRRTYRRRFLASARNLPHLFRVAPSSKHASTLSTSSTSLVSQRPSSNVPCKSLQTSVLSFAASLYSRANRSLCLSVNLFLAPRGISFTAHLRKYCNWEVSKNAKSLLMGSAFLNIVAEISAMSPMFLYITQARFLRVTDKAYSQREFSRQWLDNLQPQINPNNWHQYVRQHNAPVGMAYQQFSWDG